MKKTTAIPTILLTLASIFALDANAQEAPKFQDFLAQFPAATLPYSISTQELQNQLETRPAVKAERLDWEFYQFLPELERSAQHSNMVVHPEPIAKFETENNIAVLYNLARGLSRNTKTYSISIFDKQGNYIGTHFVAGVNANVLTSVTIAEDLSADVKEYKVNWMNDYCKFGAKDNQVTGFTMTNMQTLELVTSGNPDQIEWVNQMPQDTSVVNLAKTK